MIGVTSAIITIAIAAFLLLYAVIIWNGGGNH